MGKGGYLAAQESPTPVVKTALIAPVWLFRAAPFPHARAVDSTLI